MNEEILYAVWMHRWYKSQPLETTSKQTLEILKPGIRNENSGPDFSDARVRIGETLWAGHVEIHVRSSDWELHGHHLDDAYNNVILHVVYEHDREVYTASGALLPTLALKSLIEEEKLERSLALLAESHWLRCASQVENVNKVRWALWFDRLAIQRLEQKVELLNTRFHQCHMDHEESFYRSLASAYGFRVNSPAMEMLAGIIPLRVIRKYAGNALVIESLLFGSAGMLNGFFEDDYPRKLQNEYIFFRMKHEIIPLQPEIWKFMRLRPRNFPTLRISQFARMLSAHPRLIDEVLETNDAEKVTGIFTEPASVYWNEHYQFDKKAGKITPAMGWESASLILINAVVPFLFYYGKERGEKQFMDRAIRFLEQTGAERNSAMRDWKDCGIEPVNALQSQALLQLRSHYCREARCLSCSIGISLLLTKREKLSEPPL